MNTTETLTEEERGWLESDPGYQKWDGWLEPDPEYQKWDVRRKALRIIDAQAADRAALVAQVDGLNTALDTAEKRYVEVVSENARLTEQVAQLTAALDTVTDAFRKSTDEWRAQTQADRSEVTRLTEALADAERAEKDAVLSSQPAQAPAPAAAETELADLRERVARVLTKVEAFRGGQLDADEVGRILRGR